MDVKNLTTRSDSYIKLYSTSSNKFVSLGLSENQDGRPGNWLTGTFSTSLLNLFNETWQEARTQRHPPSLCFFGRSENHDGRLGLLFAETFSTSTLQLLNGIQRNLTGSKNPTSCTKYVFFGTDWKTKMATLASWLTHFWLLLSNHWT